MTRTTPNARLRPSWDHIAAILLICWLAMTSQHSHAAGGLAQFLDGMLFRAAHGAQHPPGQGVASQRLQGLAGGGVHGGIGAAGQHARGGAVDLAALHQKGERFAPGVQRRADDLGAFGDEDTLFGLQLIAQLGLGEPGVRSQLGGG